MVAGKPPCRSFDGSDLCTKGCLARTYSCTSLVYHGGLRFIAVNTRGSRSAPGFDELTYRKLKLWFRIDPIGRLVIEGFPTEMKRAKVIYIRSEWSNPKSYRAISLLSTVGRMAEKVVVDYLSLVGEMEGWWHSGQCGSRSGRSTTGASAYLKGDVAKNRRMDASALIMLDVAAAFPSTTKSRVLEIMSSQWRGSGYSEVDTTPCWVTVLLCRRLQLGLAFVEIQYLQQDVTEVKATFKNYGLQDRFEVAWIHRLERPGTAIKIKARRWSLTMDGKTHRYNPKAQGPGWLGFRIDPRLDWKQHVSWRLALGRYHLGTVSRVLTAVGVKRSLARKIAAMATAAYRAELM
jgi:hypothetical protein